VGGRPILFIYYYCDPIKFILQDSTRTLFLFNEFLFTFFVIIIINLTIFMYMLTFKNKISFTQEEIILCLSIIVSN